MKIFLPARKVGRPQAVTYAMREKYVAAHPVRGVGLPPDASQKPADEWLTAESLAATLEAQRASSAHYSAITEWTPP